MLSGLRLVGPQFHRLPQSVFRILEQACVFHDPAHMLKRHQSMRKSVRRAFGGRFNETLPLLNSLRAQTRIFECPAEIDMSRPKQALLLQAGSKRMDRSGYVPQLT